MTCNYALEALLDADFTELHAGITPLALHLRDCARCRRVADTLVADTQLLASRRSVVSIRRRLPIYRYAFAPVAVALAVLVMLTVRNQPPAPATVVSTLAPVVVDSFPAARATPMAARLPAPRPLRPFPRTVAVAAVKMNQSEPIAYPATSRPAAREVSVAPPAGTRAVVMQTGDPRVVVVWLY